MAKKTNETTNIEEITLTPKEYFDTVKGKVNEIEGDDDLKALYENGLKLLNKYVITGQSYASKRLVNILETIEKEMRLRKLGITKYINREDIEEYIEHVADKAIKVCEISQFERDIPDEFVDVIANTKGNPFDEYFIIFTDYTKEDTKKIAQRKRDKDPILVGNIAIDGLITNRMYYIGDWVDEYCDLTLDKLVAEMTAKGKENPVKETNNVKTLEELKDAVKKMGN